jgi:hypothetical protein
MRIDEKVRDAHLEHFCPGRLGLAVMTSRPAWPGRHGAAQPALDGNAARGRPAMRALRIARDAGAGRPQARQRDLGTRELPGLRPGLTAAASPWRPG